MDVDALLKERGSRYGEFEQHARITSICSDEPLFASTYSVCSISSRHAATFTHDNCTHCDCTHCTLPHSTSVALKHYKDLNATNNLPLS